MPSTTARACRAAWLALLLGACSSQQLYHAGQEWQRTECRKLAPADQERCLASNAVTYDEYERERAAAGGGSSR
ncbi:MAG TPA: hypothetical protein PK163_09010 [Steroidobacteraceae bacterium]|nr:hypothetical protein [Steroidobacteraceae bacterium]